MELDFLKALSPDLPKCVRTIALRASSTVGSDEKSPDSPGVVGLKDANMIGVVGTFLLRLF